MKRSLKLLPLILLSLSELSFAAGPYTIGPHEVRGNIPTWCCGRHTKVVVNCEADGRFEFTAGGAPTEINYCRAGRNEYERNFGGVWLSIKNLTVDNIKVYTE